MSKRVYLILIIIIGVISVAGYLFYNQSGVSSSHQACLNSGGEVVKTDCCEGTEDFPNLCQIEACDCSPENSQQVKTCDCGAGKCFNGEKCIEREKMGSGSNFQEEGNLFFQQGEKWLLMYEKSGEKQLVDLQFNEDSVCNLRQDKKPCEEYENDYGESGDEVKVIGNKEDGVVEVNKLIYVE